jgi:cation diffusion facilitator family transporter
VSILPDYGDPSDPQVRARYGMLEARVGLGGNALVFVGKLLLGLSVASIAILGDSMNHLADIAVSTVILYSFYVSARPADEEHPYGHGRAESILAVVVSSLIISMGALVIREAVSGIYDPAIEASMSTVYLMLAFTAVKVFLAAFAFSVARKIDSQAIRADGWNHVSDTLISLAVAGGVTVTILYPEYRILDPALAVCIGAFVIAVGIRLVCDSAASLMGKAPDRATIEGISAIARSVPGVIDTHRIEVHEYGSFKAISMHIHVSESMGAGEAHDIADKVERCIMDKYRTRPLVHIDPIKRHCDECDLAMIRDIAKGFPDVVSVHKATIQHANDGAVVDMHVIIDGKLSIEKGHALVHDIMAQVERRFPKHRADIHLEPCSGDCQACKETCDKRTAPPRG